MPVFKPGVENYAEPYGGPLWGAGGALVVHGPLFEKHWTTGQVSTDGEQHKQKSIQHATPLTST